MKKLDLGCNLFGDAGAHLLSGSIHRVDDLSLNSCNIAEEGVKVLAEQIFKRNTAVNQTLVSHWLRTLNLRYDFFQKSI